MPSPLHILSDSCRRWFGNDRMATRFILILFIAMATAMIVVGHGLPYVMDGNETYSSILHARNILHFGIDRSAGLADDATGLMAEAHPVVHTHQGNFPRVFATLLYWLGARSPEAQIILTTLLIGVSCIALLMQTLRQYLGGGIAVWALIFLITDYIFFDQWALVTYRIWLPMLLACALAITHYWHHAVQDAPAKRRRILAAAFVLYVCMFYFELIFMTFIAVTAGVWNLWLNRKQFLHAVKLVGVQLAGAITGAGLVVVQLIHYLGWDGFLIDFRLTYLARNEGVDSAKEEEVFQAFAEKYNTASFHNFQDGSVYRTISFFKQMIFKYGLELYSPTFAYAIILLALSGIIALYWKRGSVRRPEWFVAGLAALSILSWMAPPSTIMLTLIIALIVGSTFGLRTDTEGTRIRIFEACVFLLICLMPLLLGFGSNPFFLGFDDHFSLQAFDMIMVAIFGTLLIALPLIKRAASRRFGKRTIALDAVIRGGCVLTFASIFARYHYALSDQAWAPLWFHSFLPPLLQRLFLLLVTIGAAVVAMFSPQMDPADHEALLPKINRVLLFLGCFAVGLISVQILFPGYLYSGYMVRSHNILFLPFALMIGTVVWLLLAVAKNIAKLASTDGSGRLLSSIIYAAVATLCMFWFGAQATIATALPPTGFFGLANALRALPAGATIVSNNYTAPFTVLTSNWSYIDAAFAGAEILRDTEKGYRYPADHSLLWQVDRATNAAYARPSYYVCFYQPDLSVALQQVDPQYQARSCKTSGLARLALQKQDGIWPENEVVATGEPDHHWMVIKLDWDFSPYLAAPITLNVIPSGASTHLDIGYQYRQQDNVPETKTQAAIYAIERDGGNCSLTEQSIEWTQGRNGKISIDAHLASMNPYIVVVHSFTETRKSEPFFSLPFTIEKGHKSDQARCNSVTDQFGNQWSTSSWHKS